MVILWYTVYDMVNFEFLHRIDPENLIGMIKKYKIQIHTLVCFTKKHIKICLVIRFFLNMNISWCILFQITPIFYCYKQIFFLL